MNCPLPGATCIAVGSLARAGTRLLAWLGSVLVAGVVLATPGWSQVPTTLVPLTGKSWRYNDTGADLGTAWRGVNYPTESTWRSGTGLFGVESSTPYPYPVPLQTPLILGAGRITYYFRTHFTFSGSTNNILLQTTAYIDDGAVFYLNGAEAGGRVRLPLGPITYTTKADLAVPEGQAVIREFPVSLLVQGDNVLAAEVHQNSDTSSDVVFGMNLETYALVAPSIRDPSEPANRTVPEGQPTTLSVSASGFPPPAYQWFKNGSLIPGATESSLTLPSVRLADTGSYYVVVTNRAGTVSSRTALVSFLADTNPPTVLYALAQPNSLYEVKLAFSEPVDESVAIDNFSWSIEAPSGGSVLDVLSGRMEDRTNLFLTTLEPRDSTLTYQATVQSPISDLYDNAMAIGTVIPIASFSAVLLPDDATQSWRYNDLGVDPGPGWMTRTYDDTAWRVGLSPFDAFRPFTGGSTCRTQFPVDEKPIRTCLTLSNAANTAQIPAAYFRTHFRFEGNPDHGLFDVQGIFNDGAVLYLNGVELGRIGMPSGTITYNTLAARRSIGQEELSMPAPSLVAGDNLLAVELHQESLDSPDLTLALRITGFFPNQPLFRPQLSYRRINGNLELTWTSGSLQSASDITGPWSPVIPSNPPSQHLVPPSSPQMFFRVIVSP